MGIPGTNFFFEGWAVGVITKKDLKKLSYPKTTLVFLIIKKTSQHLFGVRMQNYFNFQVHAHTVVPNILTAKSWFFWNNLTLISTKIIILHTTKY